MFARGGRGEYPLLRVDVARGYDGYLIFRIFCAVLRRKSRPRWIFVVKIKYFPVLRPRAREFFSAQ